MTNDIINALTPLYIIPILGLTASAMKPPIKFLAGEASMQRLSLTAAPRLTKPINAKTDSLYT